MTDTKMEETPADDKAAEQATLNNGEVEAEKAATEATATATEETNKMETANDAEAATAAATAPEVKAVAVAEEEEEDAQFAENEVYKKLRSQKVPQKIAVALLDLYETTEMTADDLDERALEMLCGFPEDQSLYIVKEVKVANLIGVQNKAQYLMSIMRNFRDKVRQMGATIAMSQQLVHGPDADKIREIMERTGYPFEVTIGQRKFGGPPPGWEGPASGPTGIGHEIYVGKIPKEIFEDTLIELFEPFGKIWDLRLMMDPLTGRTRGYAFVTFCEKEAATEAAKKYDGHEIMPGKKLKVNVSVANTRLFIGNIPKSKSKEEILAEFKEHTVSDGVVDCIIYSSPDAAETRKNRGFCFLDFCDHKTASEVKRRLHAGKIRPWNSDLVVDWAEQQDEPDEETMSKVKVLYVRNLKEAVTEEQLKEMFGAHGELERAKKIRDYAFIHFKERDPAVKAMEALNGTVLEGVEIEISLAKPQGDKKKAVHGGRGRGGFGSPRGGAYGGADYGGAGGGYGGMRGGGGGGSGGMQRGQRGPTGAYGARAAAPYGAPPLEYGYGGYDPYDLAAYDDYYGYGAAPAPAYGGYPGYDSYGYGAPDPYAAYGGDYGGRGGARSGMGYMSRSGGGGGGGGRGKGPRGGRGSGGRGAKRPGDTSGGPASKREFGNDDFSADVNMTSF